MARIKIVERESAPQEVAELYDEVKSRGATVINVQKVVANSPKVVRNFIRLGNSLLQRSKLEPKLRELAIMRTANLAGCEYEWKHHQSIALQAGVKQEQLDQIANWQTAPVFDERERDILRYVDQVAQKIQVPDDIFAGVRRHLEDQEIAELTLSIGYWGMVARFIIALQVDLEQRYWEY